MQIAKHRSSMLLLIVLSGVVLAICMGVRQSLGLFMRPMTLDLGISAATFGFTIAVQNVMWGFSQPFLGALAALVLQKVRPRLADNYVVPVSSGIIAGESLMGVTIALLAVAKVLEP